VTGAVLKRVILVYRPAHDYEESLESYFVCLSETEAKTAAARMNEFLRKLADRLPKIDWNAEWSEAWQKAYDRRDHMLDHARWPYGVNLKHDINRATYGDTVQVKNLDVRGAI